MCLRNLQKKLVHGALIEAEILTSPLPHAFAQLGHVLGTSTLPMGVSTPPKWFKMFLSVSGTSKKLIYRALIEAEILTSTPHVFHQWNPVLGTGTLPTGMSTPIKWSKMFLCALGTSKNLVYGALIEADILTFPLPHVFVQLSPVLGTGTLPMGVSTPTKWSRNLPLCLRNLQKIFVLGC